MTKAMKVSICTRVPRMTSVSRRLHAAGWAGLALWTAGLLVVSGCSSGGSFSKLKVGPITFTDANGTAKAPIKSITAGQSAYVDVTLTGDPQLLGADWSVYCGSALPAGTPLPPGQPQDQSCGTFTPAHTISGPVPSYATSGAGYVTLYTAPATPPKEGTVTLYTAATSDHSRWTSVTLTIEGLPISVGFAPAPPSTLEAGAGTQVRAVLNNDTTNAGVSWSVICSSSDCGSFSPISTTSGVATTYTAPASVPTGGVVKITATSVADPTKAFSSSIAITAAASSTLMGRVQAAQQPVGGARISLYAAMTGEGSPNEAMSGMNASPEFTGTTDEQGDFLIPYGYQCPAPDAQMYLVSAGGNAGGGTNPDLALIAALGPCRKLGSSHVIVNEATTVAAVYALSAFITDAQHIGSVRTSHAALATAFATANDLVDSATGLARSRTVSGVGVVPQAKINLLANLLSACARTAGSAQGDGSPCDQLFQQTNSKASSAESERNTLQALLDLARNATGSSDRQSFFATLNHLAASSEAFGPALATEPADWTLAIQFSLLPASKESAGLEAQSLENARFSTDVAGNVWITTNGKTITEFVGGASCAGAPKGLLPIAFDSGNTP